MELTRRQQRFIDEYLVDCNGQRSAIAAGYAPKSAKVTACNLLTQHNVKVALQKRQKALAATLQVRREDIVRGLLETIDMARQQGDAQAMVRAAAEINKMLGFYLPRTVRTEADRVAEGRDLQRLSDEELLAMLAADASVGVPNHAAQCR